MDDLEYKTEYAQNAFGNMTGNRARKKGTYQCSVCGDKFILWVDYGRLPFCDSCGKAVEWELEGAGLKDAF